VDESGKSSVAARTITVMVGHVTESTAGLLAALPEWVTLIRANNANPMTLDGTNTWVLRVPGSDERIVVDPGPLEEPHLAAIAAPWWPGSATSGWC
jgi:glyoxylase-like metal-dependent hydrolase (beta-lactamase superfamily II)